MADAAERGGRTRRTVLRAVFSLGVLGGTATALAPVVRAGRGAPGTEAEPQAMGEPAPAAAGPPADGPQPGVVEETYKGRRIRVGTTAGEDASFAAAAGAPGVYAPTPSHDIQIDGRPLHVMRRADGSYVSVVNHYESFPTRLAVARAAVDDLRGAQLSRTGPMLHHA